MHRHVQQVACDVSMPSLCQEPLCRLDSCCKAPAGVQLRKIANWLGLQEVDLQMVRERVCRVKLKGRLNQGQGTLSDKAKLWRGAADGVVPGCVQQPRLCCKRWQ